MSRENFERFRQLVLRDVALQQRLRETPDRESFITLALQLGEERGYSFVAEDVEAAIQASRHAWRLRWI